jgi:hypothetical protein
MALITLGEKIKMREFMRPETSGDSRSRLVVWLNHSQSVPTPLPATMKGAYTETLSEAI